METYSICNLPDAWQANHDLELLCLLLFPICSGFPFTPQSAEPLEMEPHHTEVSHCTNVIFKLKLSTHSCYWSHQLPSGLEEEENKKPVRHPGVCLILCNLGAHISGGGGENRVKLIKYPSPISFTDVWNFPLIVFFVCGVCV